MTVTLRRIALTLAMAVLATFALVSVPVDHARATAYDVYTLLNQYRAANGRPALARMPSLDTVAQNWSSRMASTNTLAHNPSFQAQYPAGWRLAGENVGYGPSAKTVHDALVASPGHRANMLDSRFNAVGIGFVNGPDGRVWITQNFAQYDNVSAYQSPSTADRKLVRGVYLDMMGREPDPAGWDAWSRAVMTQGRPVVANGFGDSSEYRRRTITAAYVQVLGRNPGASEVTFWERAVANRSTNLDRVPRDFYASDEFFLRAGNTNEAFIRRMYVVALGRTSINPSEISFWSGQINSRGRAAVIADIYGSRESSLIRVDRAYQRWLGRTAGGSERDYWATTIQKTGDEGMRYQLLISQEYYLRAQNR